MLFKQLLSVVFLLATVCKPAMAEPTLNVLMDRQREMKEIAAATKTISEMFKAPETYSSESFKQAARAISDRADQQLVDHYAATTAAEGSDASDLIASDPDRFNDLAQDLKTYADKLAEAADKQPDSMSDEMRMDDREPMGGGPLGTRIRNNASLSAMSAEHAFHLMLQTCTSCHARFRTK